METYYQIQNPKTNKWIYINSPTYNKLIDNNEYSEEYLTSLPMKLAKKPKGATIRLKTQEQTSKKLKNINLPDEILLEEILMNMDNPDFVQFCQTNKKFNKICNDDKFWQRMYNKYYKNSGLKEEIEKTRHMTYKEAFEYAYNLSFLVNVWGMPLLDVYDTSEITIKGYPYIKREYKAISYLDGLEVINIVFNDINSLPPIPYQLKRLPNLKKIIYEKQ